MNLKKKLKERPLDFSHIQKRLSAEDIDVVLSTLKFQIDNGLLKYKSRIVLSPTSS